MWNLKQPNLIAEDIHMSVRLAWHSLLKREDLGFKNIERFDDALLQCQEQAPFLQDKKKIVVIGMGGSSLGAKALYQSLWPWDQGQRLIFLDNVDGFSLDHFLGSLAEQDLNEIAWLLCSKSGRTIEVLSLFDYAYQFLQRKYKHSLIGNTVVICGPQESPLLKFAREHDLAQLTIPPDVGGRFSVFTSVGVFPLLFMGLDGAAVRAGLVSSFADEDVVCELSALLLHSLQQGANSFYCFHYSDRLSAWSLWLQQLWSESLGKKRTRDGMLAPIVSTFVPCRGASDQHSVLQQVIEGNEEKFVGFIRVKSSEKSRYQISESLLANTHLVGKSLGQLLSAQAEATQQAAQQAGLKTFCLETEELNPTSMASLMGLWMMTIGLLGEALLIDAFNQPGVESGKIIARRVLNDPH